MQKQFEGIVARVRQTSTMVCIQSSMALLAPQELGKLKTGKLTFLALLTAAGVSRMNSFVC